MVSTPQTWHYGLVAEWWEKFNTEGPEIEYFGRFVAAGQPALDAGCGAGRLLLPWLHAGYDVDGCDVSADMIARCREQASGQGLDPALFVQPLHALEPPRRYRTIVVCGVFGLGSTRVQDEEALRRFHDCLEPDGTLLLDNHVPYSSECWPLWRAEQRRSLPEEWPPPGERRLADDGSEYELRVRVLELDPLDQTIALELRADKWIDGKHVAAEEHALTMRMYFRDELVLMLRNAGFAGVAVRGGYADDRPTGDHDFLVYIASRSASPTSVHMPT
jgi:SAM-dependent methyltransferase